MPDIVVDGRNGRLVSSVDPDGMGHALVDLLSDGQNLMSLRSNARQIAEQRFSLEGQARAYLELYEQVVAKHAIKNG
jgi:glycosyltransferase involved in cell wall biosynthesis